MSTPLEVNKKLNTLYERDYYQWLRQTATLLKKKEFTELDLGNLIEEIESLGKSEKRAVKSNLVVLILHLLKWRYQPEKRSRSWKSSIREHRRRIEYLLSDSPSLKNYLSEISLFCQFPRFEL